MVQRRTLPPLNAVRAFEAAARLGSFKDAAVELGVTHGAISQQVRLLEDRLGAPELFRRATRRVTLTPAGTALLDEVGPALDRIASAVQRHRATRGEVPAAVLRVNALATFSMRWLLPRLRRFRDERPDIEVRLTTSNDPIDALADTFDVVIRGGPDSFYGFTSGFFLRSAVCRSAALHSPRRSRWMTFLISLGTLCYTSLRCRGFGMIGCYKPDSLASLRRRR
ncbi:LysR family transcriptional regulator, glycine cleavage system transcriptional activator [Bradyrhizobium arachidis]|nr:LysR family transcriptional regulator, glycine cleavage system transcriptional activator [Bradyrhizobium arachidis]